MGKHFFIALIFLAILLILFYSPSFRDRVQGGTPGPEPSSQEDQSPSFSREEIMDYLAENVAELSPAKPVLGGSWHVNRFWFIDDNNVYVEYEDGHILRQILVKIEEGKYKMTGYFEPGETGWILKKGEDPFFAASQKDLYEYVEEIGRWMKKN